MPQSRYMTPGSHKISPRLPFNKCTAVASILLLKCIYSCGAKKCWKIACPYIPKSEKSRTSCIVEHFTFLFKMTHCLHPLPHRLYRVCSLASTLSPHHLYRVCSLASTPSPHRLYRVCSLASTPSPTAYTVSVPLPPPPPPPPIPCLFPCLHPLPPPPIPCLFPCLHPLPHRLYRVCSLASTPSPHRLYRVCSLASTPSPTAYTVSVPLPPPPPPPPIPCLFPCLQAFIPIYRYSCKC